MRTKLVFLALLVLAGQAAAKPFGNARFNFWIDVPPVFSVAEPEPENGDGRSFKTADGAAELGASGHWIILDDFVAEVAQSKDFLKQDGWKLTYESSVAKHSASYSGVKGDDILYARDITTCKNKAIVSYKLSYPSAQKLKFEPLIKKLNASFKEGIGTCGQ